MLVCHLLLIQRELTTLLDNLLDNFAAGGARSPNPLL